MLSLRRDHHLHHSLPSPRFSFVPSFLNRLSKTIRAKTKTKPHLEFEFEEIESEKEIDDGKQQRKLLIPVFTVDETGLTPLS